MGPLIHYQFKENNTYENKIINVDEFLSDMELSYSSNASCDSECDLLEFDYNSNYNVKSLSQIMEYYELSKKNMRKDEMIQLIILFEMDATNTTVVNRRRRLWKYINELKQDKYFSKFILFTI